ncbi:hypothetical protein FB451DRAFT_1161677 [Mycena latifolia]|nr:hypothetical protein FB451DRAFT_1161677 [Mycena latifolia]
MARAYADTTDIRASALEAAPAPAASGSSVSGKPTGRVASDRGRASDVPINLPVTGVHRGLEAGRQVGEEYPSTDEGDPAIMDANAKVSLSRAWACGDMQNRETNTLQDGAMQMPAKVPYELLEVASGLSKTVVQPCLRADDWRHGTACVESKPRVIGSADGGYLGGRSRAGGADSQKELEYEKIYTRLSTETGEEGDRNTHHSHRNSRSWRRSDDWEWSKDGDVVQPNLSSSRSRPGTDSQKKIKYEKIYTRLSTETGEEGDRGTHRSRRDSRSCRRSDECEWSKVRDAGQPKLSSSRSRAGGADSQKSSNLWKMSTETGEEEDRSTHRSRGGVATHRRRGGAQILVESQLGTDSQKKIKYEKIYTRLSTETGEEGDRGTHRSRRDSRSCRRSDECEWSKAGDAGQPKLSSSRSRAGGADSQKSSNLCKMSTETGEEGDRNTHHSREWSKAGDAGQPKLSSSRSRPGGADSQKSSNLCKMSTETGEEGDRNTHHSREWSKAGDAGQPKLSSSRSRPGGADSQKSSNLCKMSTEMGEEGDRGTQRSHRNSRSCRRSDDREWSKDGDVVQPNLSSSRSRRESSTFRRVAAGQAAQTRRKGWKERSKSVQV